MNETVEFLVHHADPVPHKPELPVWRDNQSFLEGFTLAVEAMNYALKLANKKRAITALSSTDDENDPKLVDYAKDITMVEQIRSGLMRGMASWPQAIANVELMRNSIPAEAFPN